LHEGQTAEALHP